MTEFGQEFWDARFENAEFAYGKEPASFMREQAHHLTANSRVLVPADGEGRNSVYLASLGHAVVATDISVEGLRKAKGLAESLGVNVDQRRVDVHSWNWPDAEFDAVVSIFVQFSAPAMRGKVFAGMRRAVKPGGLVFLHGYSETQLNYGTGGPPLRDHLYTKQMLREAFGDWSVLRLEEYERELKEGSYHVGRSALVDLVARRPES